MKRAKMATYEDVRQSFEWDIPTTFNFGGDVVDEWAKDPKRLALIWTNDKGQERRFTYADIRDLTNQFANYLAFKGVKKGDRVLVMLPRLPEWQIALVGCHKLGAIPIPCVTMLTRKDIAYRLDHSGAVAAVTTAGEVDKVSDDVPVRLCVGEASGWDSFDDAIASQSKDFTPAEVQGER